MSDSSSITTEGARRFQCIGGDCEYTCCAGWKIPVDPVHHDLLKARMEATASGRRAFANVVTRDAVGGASMKLLASGDCACLSAGKLCHIQVTYGEALLPNACAQYPRGLGIVGGQREMWGSLSCPEMARQCLLAEDGMALVQIADEPFSRPLERRALANPERPYDAQLDVVRAAVSAVLSLRQLSVACRLYLLASLGERTKGFFHREAATLDGARLEAELASVRAPSAALQATFAAVELPAGIAASVVASVLQLRHDRELRPLISKVLGSYVAEGSVTATANGDFAVRPDRLWQGYRQRRAAWEASFGDRIELALEAHARSYWLKEWYVTSPNLLAHLRAYLFQAVVVRFLLFGHPALPAVADRELARGALDRALVEVVSRVTRAGEHNLAFVREIEAAFQPERGEGFSNTAALTVL